MGFEGETYVLPCSRGGLMMSTNHDALPSYAMVEGSKNLRFKNFGRESRGGTSHVNGTALSGTPEISSLIDYQLMSGNQFLVLYSNDGKVWKNYTESLGTLTASMLPNMEVFADKLYICTGADVPNYWDGVSATLTAMDSSKIPLDWTGANHPKWMVKHGRGNQRRMWAAGVPGKLDTLYISGNVTTGANPEFQEGCGLLMTISTGHGKGLVGGISFGEKFIVFGKRRSFIIDDESTDSNEWGYHAAPWEGGVAHQRLIIKAPNDIICMTDDGDIYSIASVQSSNDYKAASIAAPAFMDVWIRKNLDLSLIDKFHGVYDIEERVIKFFVIRKGRSTVDTCLTYSVDRPPAEAWMLHDNLSFNSGYNAASSTLVKTSSGYKVHTGDYAGFVWELETSQVNDNGQAFYKGFKTPQMLFDSPRKQKKYVRGWVSSHALGSIDYAVKSTVDAKAPISGTVSVNSGAALWGEKLWGTFTWGEAANLIDKTYPIHQIGTRLQTELYSNEVDEKFFVSKLMYDFNLEGNRIE